MPSSRNDNRNDDQTATPSTAHPRTAPPTRNDIRDDNTPVVACPICATAFTPIRRQRYCTPACRQAAWRARHHNPRPAITIPPATKRHTITIYQCPACDTRQLGQQWCHDCNQPCRRVDLGGLCPHCDEPVTISDILDQHPTRP
jgi:hypothetical protein